MLSCFDPFSDNILDLYRNCCSVLQLYLNGCFCYPISTQTLSIYITPSIEEYNQKILILLVHKQDGDILPISKKTFFLHDHFKSCGNVKWGFDKAVDCAREGGSQEVSVTKRGTPSSCNISSIYLALDVLLTMLCFKDLFTYLPSDDLPSKSKKIVKTQHGQS